MTLEPVPAAHRSGDSILVMNARLLLEITPRMAAAHPMTFAHSTPRKRDISFSRKGAGIAVDLPCGTCIGCLTDRARQWATRIMHEAQLHNRSSFVTLTYSPENMPRDGGLVKRHVQLFLKRLRKTQAVRFFACGEYGSLNLRPHYHLCIFGYDFPDKVFFSSKGGNPLYVSRELDQLWPHGFATVGALSFASASYVARYCLKKAGPSKEVREWVNPDTGEITTLTPEYMHCSLRPGIGSGWFKRFGSDVYPSDQVIVEGRSYRPPRYYDSLLERQAVDRFEEVKRKRLAGCLDPDRVLECDSVRNKVKAVVKSSALTLYSRSL